MTTTTKTAEVRCPKCGEKMDQVRRGVALRRQGPAYLCPNAKAAGSWDCPAASKYTTK